MSRTIYALLVGLVPTVLPLACGSLNKGEVVIVDEAAGAVNLGGSTSGNAGKGGSTAGGRGGGGTGGGTSGDAGEAGVGTSGKGGSTGQGGTSSKGGTTGKGGSSTSGDAGSGGGGGEPPSGCTDISDCVASAPICEDGTCRSCEAPVGSATDECAELTATPHCDDRGRCVECLADDDCSGGSRPVCDGGACRACEQNAECASGYCKGGRCADSTSIVYALAQTGSTDPMSCGTQDRPCRYVATAATLLSASRPVLVLVKTTQAFSYEQLVLPALPGSPDLAVVGNHVTIQNWDEPAITISGGNVTLDDVVADVSPSSTSVPGFSAINCTGARLTMTNGSVSNASSDYASRGIRLVDCTADIEGVTFTGSADTTMSSGYTAVTSDSTAMPPNQTLTVQRCLFEKNYQVIYVNADHFVIRNNLFVSNGLYAYTTMFHLEAQTDSIFGFNTLYGNDNDCNPERGLITCGTNCGTHTSNLSWGNLFSNGGCPELLYSYGGPTVTYTLAETTWPGFNNISGEDPLFTAPMTGDFTPGPGSPAINAGNSDATLMPDVDYFGNPRPVGSRPDIGAIEAQ